MQWTGKGRAVTPSRAVGWDHVALGMDTWILQNQIRQQTQPGMKWVGGRKDGRMDRWKEGRKKGRKGGREGAQD